MSSEQSIDHNEVMDVIPIHFDLPKHSLSLNEFIDTAHTTRAIIEDFNTVLFDGKLRYQLHVLPPRNGGFVDLIGISIAASVAAKTLKTCLECLETDVGKAFVEGLTGKKPNEWAKMAGEFFKDAATNAKNKLTKGQVSQERKIAEKTTTLIIKQITLNFFQTTPQQLKSIGISKAKFRESLSSRNRFFDNCKKNQELRAIGFSEDETFSIPRAAFPEYYVDIPPIEEEKKQIEWETERKTVLVFSPNWHRDGRAWLGTLDGAPVSFNIEDELFWDHAKLNKITPRVEDKLEVQWAYPAGGASRRKIKVLRVLAFNGVKLAEPLTKVELESILENLKEDDDSQMEMPFNPNDDGDQTS